MDDFICTACYKSFDEPREWTEMMDPRLPGSEQSFSDSPCCHGNYDELDESVAAHLLREAWQRFTKTTDDVIRADTKDAIDDLITWLDETLHG